MKSRSNVSTVFIAPPMDSSNGKTIFSSAFFINALSKFCFLIAAVLSFSISNAQTGPGGIGNKMGTSTLEVWLEAGDLDGDDIFTDNPANTTAVGTWTDKSGNANHLVQATAANQPLYTTGTFNSVQFSAAGTVDYMNFSTASFFTPGLIPGTAYFVLNATDAGTVSNTLLDDDSRSLRWEQYNATNRIGYTRYDVNDYTSSLAPNYGNNTILGFLKGGTNNLQVRQNNATSTLSIGSTTDGIPLTRMGATVAADAANYKAMEVIVFNSVLNTAQIRIIENYLSAKYGGISISNDQYTMDNAGTDFDYDVAGLGRIDASNLHDDAQSSIVEILSPSSLSDNDFLYFGHNGGVLQSNSTDLPTGIQSKLQRIWGVSEVNNIGTVTIRFDLTNLGSVTPSDLRLLIDTDNDGNFQEGSTVIVSGATAFTGNIYQFALVNVNYTNFRFTLGTINSSVTPLPVELVSFDSKANDGKVTLTWETATEINNNYFTLYRSADGLNYSEIAHVNGNGTTNQRQYYEYVDNTPPSGRIYYKLNQTDYDGTEEYAGITTTEVTLQNSHASVYPNPVKPGSWVTVQLHSEPDGNLDFNLSNITGQVRRLEFESSNGALKVFIPENIPRGTYIMSTGSGGKSNQIKVSVQ